MVNREKKGLTTAGGSFIQTLAKYEFLMEQLISRDFKIKYKRSVLGVFWSAIGVYAPLAQFAGAGASIPLTGFGHALVTGVKRAVQEIGILGAFTGGLTNTAAGISAAVFFGVYSSPSSRTSSV